MRVITIAAMTALFAVTMGWLPISPLMAPEQAPPEVAQQARFQRGAAAVCGQNAGWRETSNPGEIVCLTKRGHVTKTTGIVK